MECIEGMVIKHVKGTKKYQTNFQSDPCSTYQEHKHAIPKQSMLQFLKTQTYDLNYLRLARNWEDFFNTPFGYSKNQGDYFRENK